MTALFSFWASHASELVRLTTQHLVLVALSTLAAVMIGVPAAIFAARRPRLGRVVLVIANALQTIPSLALFGFLLPLPFIGGLGSRTALVALALYAVLPIVRMTVTGIQSIDRSIIEAGEAMGMTAWQLLWLVQLPLATPAIVAGVRVAAVIGVGTATIAAAIGAGGLGEYIFRGLSMVDPVTILAGAIPAAVLALVVDTLLAWVERRAGQRPLARRSIAVATACVALIVAIGVGALRAATGSGSIVVGSKNYTEQVILGEMLAQAIEQEGGQVRRALNLGGTFVADRGLRTGEVDVYVEYTGTAVTAVFHEDVPHDSALALDRARALYAQLGVTVGAPLGFNNTFAILVRGADATLHGLRSVDDLTRVASQWRPGFGYEFLQRDDGYRGLVNAYGLNFGFQPKGMDLSLIYQALADRQVDVIAGDSTSALIDAFNLVQLDDTRRYFPPYDAVPLVRTATLLRRPELARAVARLAGKISERDMRALNRAVDVEHRDVVAVARDFLASLPRLP